MKNKIFTVYSNWYFCFISERKYSFDILSRLTAEEGSLEEQYVDLLINRYLKVLDTSWLENCSWEKVISKIAEIGSVSNFLFMHQFSYE